LEIALLVSAAISISYLDLQTIASPYKRFKEDLPISNTQLSHGSTTGILVTYRRDVGVGGKRSMSGTRVGVTLCIYSGRSRAESRLRHVGKACS